MGTLMKMASNVINKSPSAAYENDFLYNIYFTISADSVRVTSELLTVSAYVYIFFRPVL